MTFFYATVKRIGDSGQCDYNYLVKAKNIDDALELVREEIGSFSASSNIQIGIVRINSTLNVKPIKRIYLDKWVY